MLITGQNADEPSGNEDADKNNDNLERKKLYLLVARCIAYPFNAKYQIENSPPSSKLNVDRFNDIVRVLRLTMEDYEKVEQEYEARLTKQEHEVVKKESFLICLRWMLDEVLSRPDVEAICKNGGFSIKELELIFGIKAAAILSDECRVEDGGEVTNSDVSLWCSAFIKIVEHSSVHFQSEGKSFLHRQSTTTSDTSNVPNKDQLYKLFQRILNIRSIEHQVLYRECQVGMGAWHHRQIVCGGILHLCMHSSYQWDINYQPSVMLVQCVSLWSYCPSASTCLNPV